jgi:hypothetical protein
MRFARGDVRDQIVSHKNDHRPSYRSWRALQQRSLLKIDFREILATARFPTFANSICQQRKSPLSFDHLSDAVRRSYQLSAAATDADLTHGGVGD